MAVIMTAVVDASGSRSRHRPSECLFPRMPRQRISGYSCQEADRRCEVSAKPCFSTQVSQSPADALSDGFLLSGPDPAPTAPPDCRAPQQYPNRFSAIIHAHQRRVWPSLLQAPGDQRSELSCPASDCLVADLDPTLRQHVLDVAQAQREAKIEPYRLTDRVRRAWAADAVDRCFGDWIGQIRLEGRLGSTTHRRSRRLSASRRPASWLRSWGSPGPRRS